ncbi:hypothetical protein ACLKA7_001767 [Drosophila subpalustris]
MALDRSQEIRRKLAAPYRLAAIRVISGFRTVSEDAALVLAEMIPVDLLAREMVELYRWRQERTYSTCGDQAFREGSHDGNMAGKMGRIWKRPVDTSMRHGRQGDPTGGAYYIHGGIGGGGEGTWGERRMMETARKATRPREVMVGSSAGKEGGGVGGGFRGFPPPFRMGH